MMKGNVNALLQFHIDACDHQLRDHMETCAQNATYISKTCHNDLLICIKDYIQDAIISEVKTQSRRRLYTVDADEVTDVNRDQLGLVIRYLKDAQPVERLVEYVQCESITGEIICNNIQSSLTSKGTITSKGRFKMIDRQGKFYKLDLGPPPAAGLGVN